MKKKNLITVFILMLVIGGFIIGIFYEEIFHLPYIKVLGENNNSAIIYVWGHQYFVDDDEYFGHCDLTDAEINLIEQKCAESVFKRLKLLRDNWGWDLYIFYGVEPKNERYEYDNLLIFFGGHGNYVENHQLFVINRNKIVFVNKIGESIVCRNLTVIVDSCYSVNWHTDFNHANLTSLYTSDLCNRTSPNRPYPECTVDVQYLVCYDYIFITQLYNGLNYVDANRTTFEIYYNMFPTYNCTYDL